MTWQHKASSLVEKLLPSDDERSKTSLLSPVIYDTAWVSMIVKKDESGQDRWLFPESFQAIWKSQASNGAWGLNISEVDGILNTMAALLSMLRHRQRPDVLGCLCPASDFDRRINGAEIWLAAALNDWDVDASDHVGFEILIPRLLDLLAKESFHFNFPGMELLTKLNREKLAKFDVGMLYSSEQSTLIHSLEAFTGILDFDRVAHHLTNGSMMGSPSSTAAYLMGARLWDPNAEAYLREASYNGPDKGLRWFPSAFPTTIFTLSWTLSTLLLAGYPVDELGTDNCMRASSILEDNLSANGGSVGFGPGFVPDADDTARALLTLEMLGKENVSLDGLIRDFEMDKYFKTYKFERNPSSSANSNVLLALLHSSSRKQKLPQICKATTFLCDTWRSGTLKDKWNLSVEYPTMLLAQAFVTLQVSCDGDLKGLLPAAINDQTSIALVQILTRTLQRQESNGSWGGNSCEVTAYAILTLTELQAISWMEILCPKIEQAINDGKSFIASNCHKWNDAGFIWIEKVSYASPTLSQVYCLAALKSPSRSQRLWCSTDDKSQKTMKAVSERLRFLSDLPLFCNMEKWKLSSSLVESEKFLRLLKGRKSDIFSLENMTEDSYLDYIPFTWVGCNNLSEMKLNNSVLWDMMLISMLNYQVDEFMKSVVGKLSSQELDSLKNILTVLCQESNTTKSSTGSDKRIHAEVNDYEHLSEVTNVLSRFISHVLSHSSSLASSKSMQGVLRQELLTFLLVHINQIHDNACFAIQSDRTTFDSLRSDYYDWIHTVSAPHTSCAYSLAFFICLIDAPLNGDIFPSAKQKFLVRDVVRHLAAMCRMYNDYGSVARDDAENNLNSINFPEFNQPHATDEGGKKAELLWLAEYERECLELALSRLEKEVEASVMWKIRVFVNVTDLYGQIYLARDIASRAKVPKG